MYNYRAEMTGTGSRSFAQSVFFLLQQLQSYEIYTVSQKKFPPLNSVQILTNFQNFCTAGKRMKFATKPMQ